MFRPRPPWLLLLAAMLVPLGFAAFTGHAWEDYFITLRASRNLAEGHGLVFTPGQRLHTFTSPLGTLLPALCTWIVGPGREEAALWLFRIVNAGFLAAALTLVWRRAAALQLGQLGRVTLIGLLLFDAKLTDFSINGMETAILVFFVLLLWSELEAAERRTSRIGIALAGLMWTRPDAFVLGGALLVARLVIRGSGGRAGSPSRPEFQHDSPPEFASNPSSQAGSENRPHLLKTFARASLLAGVIYAPWFAWAWWYYGTPVPHTIVAKSAFTRTLHVDEALLFPWWTLVGDANRSKLVDLFLPTYWTFGGWPAALKHLAHGLSVFAAFAWCWSRLPATARRASLAVFIGMFYVCAIILFPWYVPPWTVLAAIAIAFGADALHARAEAARRKTLASLLRVACALVLAAQVAMFAGTAWQMRHQQKLVETPVRRAIGVWLHANAAPGDTLFLEPLGYIGYFSQLRTYDHPGLSSPEVVAAVRGGARRFADVIGKLKPTWVVLRPTELARPEFEETRVMRDYVLIKAWDGVPQLNEVQLLPGRPWMELEARYLLFRRDPAAPPETRR